MKMSLQDQIHDIYTAFFKRLGDALNKIPGFAGQACGLAVGSAQIAIMLKAVLVQDLCKLKTTEGRSEVWYGRKAAGPNGMAEQEDNDLIKAEDGKRSVLSLIEECSEETIKASGLPSLKVLKDVTYGNNHKSDLEHGQDQHVSINAGFEQALGLTHRDANASASSIAMTDPSSKHGSGTFSPSSGVLSPLSPTSPSFALTDAAAEEQLKALDVSLPPRSTEPKETDHLSANKVAGEHHSSWDLLQTPRLESQPKVIYESALPSASQDTHVDQQDIRSMPVVYESDYSMDSPYSEHARELKSPPPASPFTQSPSQHAELDMPIKTEKTAAEEPLPEKTKDPEPFTPPTTPQSSAPTSPQPSFASTTIRVTPRSATSQDSFKSSSSTSENTKQKKKGVRGAFRKIKKVLSK